jgi:hypothetical protein
LLNERFTKWWSRNGVATKGFTKDYFCARFSHDMKPINIRDAIEQVPFKPFVLEMDNGKSLRIPHRDFIFLSPAGSTAVVIEPAPEGEHTYIVDVDHVSTIRFDKKAA